MDNAPVPVGLGAVRKRIRYKQKDPTFYKALNESEEDDKPQREQRKVRQKRFSKSRSGSEGNSIEIPDAPQKLEEPNNNEKVFVDPSIVEKVVVPTKINLVDIERSVETETPGSPRTIFVKTTRKLFTPIPIMPLENSSEIKTDSPPKLLPLSSRKSLSPSNSPRNSPRMLRRLNFASKSTTLSDSTNSANTVQENIESVNELKEETAESESTLSKHLKNVTHLPPLPSSPVPQRKVLKEISPSIRIMMVKYNQKLSEQDNSGHKSGGKANL